MAWYRHTGASYRPPERVLEVVGLPFKGPSNRCHGRACDEGVHEGWYVIIGLSDFFFQKHLLVPKLTNFYDSRHFEGAPEGDMAREMDSRRLLALTKCTPTRIFPTN